MPTLFLVSQVIQNYVGLSSSLRIRRSKSLAFVGRPTISVILTLRSCDLRRQIMVIPHTFFCHSDTVVSDGTQRLTSSSAPFCHPETAGPMTCGDKLWSFCTLFHHSDTVVSDGTQRLTSSSAPFCHQEAVGPMTCGNHLVPHFLLLSSRGGGPDDMREPFGPALFTFCHLEVAGPMRCGNHLVPHFLLLSSM